MSRAKSTVLASTAAALGLIAAAPVAQAGVGVPGRHPQRHPERLRAPQQHPEIIAILRRPEIIGVLRTNF